MTKETRELAFDRALGLLYESVIAPEVLPQALSALTSSIDGDTCHLVGWDRNSGMPTMSISHGLPVEVGPDYAAHYAGIDPRRQLAMKRRPGYILNCHEHFDRRFVERDEFYQDYLIPQVGVQYLLGAGDLLPECDQLILIGFHRHIGHAAFSVEESELLRRIQPHLQRALRLQLRFQELTDAHRYAESVHDHANLATLTISAQGRVVWSNRLAMAMLRNEKWLKMVGGRLQCCSEDQDAALSKLMRGVLNTGVPGSINLAMPAAGEHCCVTLMALTENSSAAFSDQSARLLAVVTTSERRRVASVRQLMMLFGLTAAEARLVRALVDGESLESYAMAEGVKKTTVRTQLQGAFAKTVTSTQKDLVRLVVSLPSVRE